MNTLTVLKNFQNEINQLFDKSLFSKPKLSSAQELGTWHPEVDIIENDNNYQIKANLPDVEPKDIELYFSNGLLHIKGKTESKKEEKSNNYILCECSYGEFSRTLSFPDVSDDTKIDAQYKNGVLHLTIPKSQQKNAKRIEIKTQH
jgi:HSP20 family protein